MTSATEFLRDLAAIIEEYGADTETRIQVTLATCIAGLDKHADGLAPSAPEHEPEPLIMETDFSSMFSADIKKVSAYSREHHFRRGAFDIVRLYHVNEFGFSEWLYYYEYKGGKRELFAAMTYIPESDKFDISIYWDNTIIKKQYSVFDTAEMCVLVWGFDEQ